MPFTKQTAAMSSPYLSNTGLAFPVCCHDVTPPITSILWIEQRSQNVALKAPFSLFMSSLIPKIPHNPEEEVLTVVSLYSSSLTSKYPFLQCSLKLIPGLPAGRALQKALAQLENSALVHWNNPSAPSKHKSHVKHSVKITNCLGTLPGQCLSPDLGQSLWSIRAAQLTVLHAVQPRALAVPPGSHPQILENSCENSILQTAWACCLNNQEKKMYPSPLIASVSEAQRRKREKETTPWTTYLQIWILSAYCIH